MHLLRRAFEQLKVDVMTTDKRTGYIVSCVAFACIQEDAAECCGVIAEGLRGVDDLYEVCDERHSR